MTVSVPKQPAPDSNPPEERQESLQPDFKPESAATTRIAGDVTALSSDGRGIVKAREQIFFAERVVPGDRVAFIPDLTAKPPAAREVKILRKSPERWNHPCPHAKTCPASEWGIVVYEAQVREKTGLVRRVLRGVVEPELVADMWPSPQPWGYRNRLTLNVLPTARGSMEFGYALAAREARIVPIKDCLLADEEIRVALRGIFAEVRDLKTVRPEIVPNRLTLYRAETGAAALAIYTSRVSESDVLEFLELADEWPLDGGIWAATGTKSGLVESRGTFWREEESSSIHVGWLGHPIAVHPAGFSQANQSSADLVLRELAAFRDSWRPKTVWDLYGGYGALGFAAVPDGAALEVVEQSGFSESAFAALSALRPGAVARFHQGEVARLLGKMARHMTADDLVILDPPRSGCHPDVLGHLNASGARRIVYLSCNPARLARDLRILQEHGWAAKSVQPVDFFPQTPEIEVLAVIERGLG